MIQGISSISNITQIQNLQNVSKNMNVAQNSKFDNIFENAIKEVVEAEKTNSENIQKLITGDMSNINETIIGIVESDLTIQYAMQIRNKIVDAYKEIMQMQV